MRWSFAIKGKDFEASFSAGEAILWLQIERVAVRACVSCCRCLHLPASVPVLSRFLAVLFPSLCVLFLFCCSSYWCLSLSLSFSPTRTVSLGTTHFAAVQGSVCWMGGTCSGGEFQPPSYLSLFGGRGDTFLSSPPGRCVMTVTTPTTNSQGCRCSAEAHYGRACAHEL